MAAKKPAAPAKPAAAKAASKNTAAADATPGADLDRVFAAAQKKALAGKSDPGNEMKLRLYAHYKQATEGDVSGSRPGFFDMVGGAKYDAWAKLKGMAAADAKKKYIDLVKRLD